MILARRVAVEQATQERHERNALELGAAARVLAVVVRPEQRFEAMRVAQRFGGERCDHLAETDIAIGERLGLTLGAQEDRADHGRPPPNRHDDDRPHVAHVERGACALQHRIVRGVGDEHRVTRLERPLELRVPVEIDDEVSNRRILVARDQPHLGVAAGEVDRAAIQTERLAQLPSDRLEDVYEVERGGDVLQDVDDGDELITLALKLRDPLLQPGGLRIRRGIALDR